MNGATGTIASDHDGDGVSDGIEYFLGGPSADTTGFTALPGITNTNGVLSVSWTMGPDYTGVYGMDFVVETSISLIGSWTIELLGGNVVITDSVVKYTFPVSSGTHEPMDSSASK